MDDQLEPHRDPALPAVADGVWALRRDPAGALLGGVCTALSQRFGVDVLLVRIAALLLALGGGVGIVAYAWAWLVFPQRGTRESLLERWVPSTTSWSRQTHLRTAAVAVAIGSVLMALVTPWNLGPTFVLAIVVLLGWRNSRRDTEVPRAVSEQWAAPAVPAPDSDFGRAVANWHARLAEVAAEPDDTTRTGATAAPQWQDPYDIRAVNAPTSPYVPSAGAQTAAPVVPRRRGWLSGLVTLAVAAAAGTAAGYYTPVVHPVVFGHAVALFVMSASLLLFGLARRHRPRLVVFVALVTLVSALVQPNLLGGISAARQTVAWTSTAQMPSGEQRITAADVTYDLSAIDLVTTATLEVEANASRVVLLVPAGTQVRVRYNLVGSNLRVDGSDAAAISGVSQGVWPEGLASAPRAGLDLVVTARASQVEVRHA